METLKLLYEYFPTAVYTGKCLVFISEDWRVELTEHKDSDYTKPAAAIAYSRQGLQKGPQRRICAGTFRGFPVAVA